MTDPPSSPDIVCLSGPPSPRFPRAGAKRRRTAGPGDDTTRAKRASTSTSSPSIPSASSSSALTNPKASSSFLLSKGTLTAALKPKSKVAVTSPNSRSRVTERMLSTLGTSTNPITHSDVFSRTDHVHSCSTGHQQRGADRGFWSAARAAGVPDANESATYWSVRTSKVEAQSREKTTSILSGCVIAINGHTGPVSNLQLQNLITSNGGRFAPHQHSGCTHVIAERLAGGKTQKYINGQGTRGAAKRTKVVKVNWVLDSVAQGKKLSEAGYSVISDPSQKSLFSALGVKPKSELRGEAENSDA